MRHYKEGDDTKKKIIHAAKREFAQKGFNGARMNSIASLAGVNQALLHYHFESKENLYIQIFHYFVGDSSTKIVKELNEEIDSWNTSIDIKLCAFIYFLITVQLFNHDADMSRIFAREIAEESTTLREFMNEYMLPRILFINGVIVDGINEGIFETSNPKIFTLNLLSFINNYIQSSEFFKGTKWYDELYTDIQNTLFSYMVEQSFKTLRPSGKSLNIPVLDSEKIKKIDDFVKYINDKLSYN